MGRNDQVPTLAEDKAWHEATRLRMERIANLWQAARALKPNPISLLRRVLPRWMAGRVWSVAHREGALVVREPYRPAGEAVIMMRLDHFEELLLAVDNEARKAAAEPIPKGWTFDD